MKIPSMASVNTANAMANATMLANRKAAKLATDIWTDMDRTSQIVDHEQEASIPTFDYSELVLGNQLGGGTIQFCISTHESHYFW